MASHRKPKNVAGPVESEPTPWTSVDMADAEPLPVPDPVVDTAPTREEEHVPAAPSPGAGGVFRSSGRSGETADGGMPE